MRPRRGCEACRQRHRKCLIITKELRCRACKIAGRECRLDDISEALTRPNADSPVSGVGGKHDVCVPASGLESNIATPLDSSHDAPLDQLSPKTPAVVQDLQHTVVGQGAKHGSLTERQAYLLRIYARNMAPILDGYDEGRYFAQEVPKLALHDDMILNGVLALGSGLERLMDSSLSEVESIFYYHQFTKLLISAFSKSPDTWTASLLTAAVLGRIYEGCEYTSDRDFVHLNGAHGVFNHPVITRLVVVGGLAEAAGWLHLRQGIHDYLMKKKAPDMRLDGFIQSTAFRTNNDSSHANRMMLYFTKTLQLYFLTTGDHETSPSISFDDCNSDAWYDVKNDIETWFERKPSSFEPIFRKDADPTSGEPFPEIRMINTATAAGLQYYHAAKIVLKSHEANTSHAAVGFREAKRRQNFERDVISHLYTLISLDLCNHLTACGCASAPHMLSIWGYLIRDSFGREHTTKYLEKVLPVLAHNAEAAVSALKQQWAELDGVSVGSQNCLS